MGDPDERRECEFSLQLDSLPLVNYAMHLNGAPLVRELVVHNVSEHVRDDLLLRVSSDAPGVEPWEARVAQIAPGDEFRLTRPPVRIQREALLNLEERESATLLLEVRQGQDLLAKLERPMGMLAYNEWAGIGVLPELLAAFVQPNHPDLQPLLRHVGEHLKLWTGDPSLSGYQRRDPARVRQMVAAVYHCLLDLDITYINPPASFEARGQKVRTVDDVLSGRMGTCLDLAVMAAALLEQIGLHPFVTIIPGHAFVGCWLAEDCFPDVVHDDDARLRNGLKLGELILFDPTVATHRPIKADFERAEAEGKKHIAAGAFDETLRVATSPGVFVVDIHAARSRGIHPLPSRKKGAVCEVDPVSEMTAARKTALEGDQELRERAERAAVADERQRQAEVKRMTRVDKWKMSLLDLTRRNRLLNFRETQNTLEVLAPKLPVLEDKLAAHEAFDVRPRPEQIVAPLDGGAGSSADEALQRFLVQELDARRLRTPNSITETDRKLLSIFRTARSNIQESGTSMLFLALGFLRWYEDESCSQERLAPVVLLPLELKRESVGAPFQISLADDEARVNRTLLEMLRSEFGLEVRGVEPPPEDDSGLDIDLIYAQFRRAVKHKRGWELVERAFVGLFSFSKFLMWHDLETRKDEIFAHPVVRHIAGGEPLTIEASDRSDENGFPALEQLDGILHPSDLYCPLDADSSQLAAVVAAEHGQTFVLEGPPGTGKSQTITNLIAHCLANGKSVLFVSEKLAALEVVQRRLKKIGLGSYCLELHSNKAQKRAVLAQLAAALQDRPGDEDGNWHAHGDTVRSIREDLNRYVELLHRQRPLGRSVFQVTSALVGLRDAPLIPLNLGSTDALSPDRWQSLSEHAERLQTALKTGGDPTTHFFRMVQRHDLPPAEETSLPQRFEALRLSAAGLRDATSVARTALGLGALHDDRRGTELLVELTDLLETAPGITTAMLQEPNWKALRNDIDEWSTHGRERQEDWEALAPVWSEALLGLPVENLCARFKRWGHAFFLIAFLMLWGARRTLKAAATTGRLPKNREMVATLERALRVQANDRFLAGIQDDGQRLFARQWKGKETDWSRVVGTVEWAGRFRRALAELSEIAPDLGVARDQLLKLATVDVERATGPGALANGIRLLATAHRNFNEAKADLLRDLQIDETAAWAGLEGPGFPQAMVDRCNRWKAALPTMRNWLHYLRVCEANRDAGLGDLVSAVHAGSVQATEVVRSFEHSVLRWWLDATTAEEEMLRVFLGAEQNRKIEKFRQLDARSLTLASRAARSRIAANAPRLSGAVARTSALGILQNELQKKRAHLATRKLFEATGDLIPRLTPCILMSPLSIAQYLDPRLPPFDLVVFDEASQVPVWDAIGAVARGKQLIVVGDPKQLPPTSFFQRTEEDIIPDDQDFVDHESILDECLAAGLPQARLGWHYRSRHEHLIAFSNYQYYDSKMLTFPSAEDSGVGRGVSWRHIPDGVYDKSRTRTNLGEAKAVVTEVVRRLSDPTLQHRSIGVVTFSQAQQTLIENLLETARRNHRVIEPFFSDDRLEPVFVKNLENVQGDERDTIFFSVCYGPDADGKVWMNFGPLNRKGGERRLNVAVTRARSEMVIFSTLKPEQIDLNRTSADGVAHLKAFLEYAQYGPRTITGIGAISRSDSFESPFEREVCEALRGAGYTVDPRIGCSGYRVDLGVRHPKDPTRYVLGVECDGATYKGASTARDRERLRQGVLNGLGWRVTRVWSADWLRDKSGEFTRLVGEIEEALKAPAPAPPAPPASPVHDVGALEPDAALASVREALFEVTNTPTELLGARPYRTHDLTGIGGLPEDFENPSQDNAIRKAVTTLVATEGPIHIDVVARRIGECWGKMRLSNLLRRRVMGVLSTARTVQVHCYGDFLWPEGQTPEALQGFRIPDESNGGGLRDAPHIPLEEMANAMMELLAINHRLPEEDILRETVKVFGIARLGKNVRSHVEGAIQLLISQGRGVLENGHVRLA